jgi:hypothetical protein
MQLSSTCGVIRPTLVSGDFFVSAPEADIHILKYIIHDWNDERSLKILSNRAHCGRRRLVASGNI